MSKYFPKPYELFRRDVNVEVDWSNYATKTDIKNISHDYTSNFALKSNLMSLKTDVDKIDIDKLVPVPVDLSKLYDVVKNDVIKKTLYEKLVTKVNGVDASAFVLKTKYNTDKKELEKKIPDTSGLVKKTDYNAKITEIEGKIPSISILATITVLTAIENKIPNISSLYTIKKQIMDNFTEIEKKLTDHNHDKYVKIPEFTTLAANVFNVRLARANFETKTDFDAKLSSLNRKITSNKSKHLLVENELKKLKAFD